MDNTNTVSLDLQSLQSKVAASSAPESLKNSITLRLQQLTKLAGSQNFFTEFDQISRYIDWVASLPWNNSTKDILDLAYAKQTLDKNHFGLEEIKERIAEYISVLKLKSEKGGEVRAPILCFVGLVGTGKTTIAYSIAEAMGRKVARIPFGGMGDPLDLRGQSRSYPEAEPGKIIKALRVAESKNPIILLDEIDRVTDAGRSSIMGVLVELLDPKQNQAFTDHYLDFPFDLSQVLFIATANNTTNIATAVLDRLEPIAMPSYTDLEKITIARVYALPKAMEEAGIPANAITFDDNVWAAIVRPLGFDAGIRTLERTVQGVVRKVAKLIVENKGTTFKITPENVKQFLPQ